MDVICDLEPTVSLFVYICLRHPSCPDTKTDLAILAERYFRHSSRLKYIHLESEAAALAIVNPRR